MHRLHDHHLDSKFAPGTQDEFNKLLSKKGIDKHIEMKDVFRRSPAPMSMMDIHSNTARAPSINVLTLLCWTDGHDGGVGYELRELQGLPSGAAAQIEHRR